MPGEYPAHVVVSVAYTDMCVDIVAALHASCMTCVSTMVCTVCEWRYVVVHCSLLLSMQSGRTPLMEASFNGQVDVVHLLIAAHADIHSRDKVW